MTQLELTYEPAAVALETHLERFPVNLLNRRISELHRMRRAGWNVTLLLAPGGKSAVALGCRGDA